MGEWGSEKGVCELQGKVLLLSSKYPSGGASQVAPVVKKPPANAGDIKDAGSIPGSGRPLEEGKATHSSIASWRIPRMEEPGGPQSMKSERVQRVGRNFVHSP